MRKLLIGTTNSGKQAEIAALLAPLGLQLLTPSEIGLRLVIEEIADSYSENARLKAARYAAACGHWAISDDTGLEVELLDGAPGPRSARFAPTAADRRRKLIGLLVDSPRPWRAIFRAVVAIADPHGTIEQAEGNCSGEIIPHARGSGGFGYDSIFMVEGTKRTMAELSMEKKNSLNHRAAAVGALLPSIRRAFNL